MQSVTFVDGAGVDPAWRSSEHTLDTRMAFPLYVITHAASSVLILQMPGRKSDIHVVAACLSVVSTCVIAEAVGYIPESTLPSTDSLAWEDGVSGLCAFAVAVPTDMATAVVCGSDYPSKGQERSADLKMYSDRSSRGRGAYTRRCG